MTLEPQAQELEKVAQQKLALFERQFGEAYRLLAYHAALPLVLTPELVHYLRTEFLLSEAEQIPWEAEADLLLSDLCSQVGYELYVMDTAVRSHLLDQMQHDDRIPDDRMQAVAQVLISYVKYLSQINPGQRQRELQAQRWAAMGYLGDESCRQVAREIAEQFEVNVGPGDVTAVKAEFARLAQITQELKPLVQTSPELVTFAQQVGRSLRSHQTLTREEQQQRFVVEGRVLSLDAIAPNEFKGFPPLQNHTFDVAEIVETDRLGKTRDLQRIPFEFRVATLRLPLQPSPPLETILEDAVAFIAKSVRELSKAEQILLRGALAGQTYQEIAKTIGYYTAPYVSQNLSSRVWKTVSTAMDSKVTKKTFPTELKRWDFRRHNLQEETRQTWQLIEDLGSDVPLELIQIPAGSVVMGSPEEEHSENIERPQHRVTLESFFLGKYPVTQAQWRSVALLEPVNHGLKLDPSHFKGDDRPVEQVSWHDAVEFCDRLSRETGRPYRLPSEAEWEYACRAGTTSPFHFGETIDAELANYNGNSTYGRGEKGAYRSETTPVGYFKVANEYGLYDMHGNVWEWCQDHWHENYDGAPIDGSAWIDSFDNDAKSPRLLRGGSWCLGPRACRSAYRFRNLAVGRNELLGFRVVCSAARTLS